MSDTVMADSSSSETKWHEWYNDPSCDAVIVSNDNVHFRASSFRLAQASDMFAKMFEVVPPSASKKGRKPKADPDPEPIPIAFDAPTVKAFLDLISLSKPVILTKDFWIITSLRELVRVHDCPDLMEYMESAWQSSFSHSSTEGFIYASQLNDVELARKALKGCSRYTVEPVATMRGTSGSSTAGFWAWMDRLRPEWQTHLIRLVLRKESYGDFRILDDWSRIADKFDPPDANGKKRPREEVEDPGEASD